jgi:hypothetical protein
MGHLWDPGGRAPLLGTPKDMLHKASVSTRGPGFGEHGGMLLS